MKQWTDVAFTTPARAPTAWRAAGARLLACGWLVAAASLCRASTVPFADNFAYPDGTTLNGTNGWSVAAGSGGSAIATNSRAALRNAAMSNTFTDAKSQVSISFDLQPVFNLETNTLPGAATLVFYVWTNGLIKAYDGRTERTLSHAPLSENVSTNVRIEINYAATNWSLFLGGTQVATNFGFYSNSVTAFTNVVFSETSTNTSYADTVSIVSAPQVSFDLAGASYAESAGTVTVGVSLAAAYPGTVTVQAGVTGGTAAGGGADYTFSPATVTFAPGQTATNFTFQIVNDTSNEPAETIVFGLGSFTNCVPSATTNFTATLQTDPADVPVVAFATVTPSPVNNLLVGSNQQFEAAFEDQFGHPIFPDSTNWAVLNGIGTIDGSGLFTATSQGSGYVTAESGGIVGTATVTTLSSGFQIATATNGASGTITPWNPTVEPGSNQAFTIAANTHYSIADVQVDSVSQGLISSYTFTNVTASHTLAAWFTNYPPTVTSAATATPMTVTSTSTVLSVAGADTESQGSLTYTWSVTPPGTVTFSANGTHAASNTTAVFTNAGTYDFQVMIADPPGLTAASAVTSVVVTQTLTTLTVTPTSTWLYTGATQQFAVAGAVDQFGHAIMNPVFDWSAGGAGTIDTATNVATLVAGATPGAYAVSCSQGGATAIVPVAVAGELFWDGTANNWQDAHWSLPTGGVTAAAAGGRYAITSGTANATATAFPNAPLRIGPGGTLAVTATTTATGTVTLAGGTLSCAGTYSLSGVNGVVAAAGTSTVSVTMGNALTLPLQVSGSGVVSKAGTGSLTLNGIATNTTLVVDGGTVTAAQNGSLDLAKGVRGTVQVNAGGTFASSAVHVFGSAPATNAPGVWINGGALALSGTLECYVPSGSSALNPGIKMTGGTFSGLQARFHGVGYGMPNGYVSMLGCSTTAVISTTLSSYNSGAGQASTQNFDVALGTVTDGPYPGVDLAITGIIGGNFNSQGTVGVTKTGNGVMAIYANQGTNGAAGFNGALAVNGGTLLANAVLAGGGGVTVANGGTLGGTGTVGSVTNNGTLAPGNNGIGVLTASNLTLNAGCTNAFELGATNASDTVTVTGTLTLNGGAITVVTNAGFGYGTYTLFSYSTSGGSTLPTLATAIARYRLIVTNDGAARKVLLEVRESAGTVFVFR